MGCSLFHRKWFFLRKSVGRRNFQPAALCGAGGCHLCPDSRATTWAPIPCLWPQRVQDLQRSIPKVRENLPSVRCFSSRMLQPWGQPQHCPQHPWTQPWSSRMGPRRAVLSSLGVSTAPYLRRVPCPEPQGAEAALQQ